MGKTRGASSNVDKSKGASSSDPPRKKRDAKGKKRVVEEDYDTFRFMSKPASDAYTEDKGWSFVTERFVEYEKEAFPYLQERIESRGWTEFLKRPPRDTFAGEIVREFYANAGWNSDDSATMVRGREIKFDPDTINAYYRIEWPSNQDDELEELFNYRRSTLDQMKEFITLPGTVVRGIPKVAHNRLTQEAKVWSMVLLSHFRPAKHNTYYGEDRIPLLYALNRGLSLNVGRIINEVLEETISKKKANIRSFVFPHLIDGLCRNAGVDFGEISEETRLTGPINTLTICKTLKLDYRSAYTGKVYTYAGVDQEGQEGLEGHGEEQVDVQPRLPRRREPTDIRDEVHDLARFVYAMSDRQDMVYRALLGDDRFNALQLPALPRRINLPPQPQEDQADEMHIDEEEERARDARNH